MRLRFSRGDLIHSQVRDCDGMLKGVGLIKVTKNAKILEFGVYGVLWVKVGFGGDCKGGV